MQIEHVRVVDLTAEQLARCQDLSFGDEGYMCEDLTHILASEQGRRYRHSIAILFYLHDGIAGWALMQPVYRTRSYSAQFFVDPDYRRRGIGARLLEESNKYSRRPYVYKDCDNEEFFNRFPNLCKADY